MDEYEYDDGYSYIGSSFLGRGHGKGKGDKPLLQIAGNKKGPSFDGSQPWFAYEQSILDWCDVTELDETKRGPELKLQLYGNAAQYRPLLLREHLIQENGVEYFLNILRPKYLKGKENIFLWRFTNFLKMDRGSVELSTWQTRMSIALTRLKDSWSDLHDDTSDQLTQAELDEMRACLLYTSDAADE